MDAPLTKVCKGACGRDLPMEMYNLHSSGKYGRQPRCKDCKRAENTVQRLADPQKAYLACVKSKKKKPYLYRKHATEWARKHPDASWEDTLRRKYNLTVEDYYELFANQGGRCKICGKTAEDANQKRLHVDHCHATNVVRGLLCGNCNRGIGIFRDDRYLLTKAIEYLS